MKYIIVAPNQAIAEQLFKRLTTTFATLDAQVLAPAVGRKATGRDVQFVVKHLDQQSKSSEPQAHSVITIEIASSPEHFAHMQQAAAEAQAELATKQAAAEAIEAQRKQLSEAIIRTRAELLALLTTEANPQERDTLDQTLTTLTTQKSAFDQANPPSLVVNPSKAVDSSIADSVIHISDNKALLTFMQELPLLVAHFLNGKKTQAAYLALPETFEALKNTPAFNQALTASLQVFAQFHIERLAIQMAKYFKIAAQFDPKQVEAWAQLQIDLHILNAEIFTLNQQLNQSQDLTQIETLQQSIRTRDQARDELEATLSQKFTALLTMDTLKFKESGLKRMILIYMLSVLGGKAAALNETLQPVMLGFMQQVLDLELTLRQLQVLESMLPNLQESLTTYANARKAACLQVLTQSIDTALQGVITTEFTKQLPVNPLDGLLRLNADLQKTQQGILSAVSKQIEGLSSPANLVPSPMRVLADALNPNHTLYRALHAQLNVVGRSKVILGLEALRTEVLDKPGQVEVHTVKAKALPKNSDAKKTASLNTAAPLSEAAAPTYVVKFNELSRDFQKESHTTAFETALRKTMMIYIKKQIERLDKLVAKEPKLDEKKIVAGAKAQLSLNVLELEIACETEIAGQELDASSTLKKKLRKLQSSSEVMIFEQFDKVDEDALDRAEKIRVLNCLLTVLEAGANSEFALLKDKKAAALIENTVKAQIRSERAKTLVRVLEDNKTLLEGQVKEDAGKALYNVSKRIDVAKSHSERLTLGMSALTDTQRIAANFFERNKQLSLAADTELRQWQELCHTRSNGKSMQPSVILKAILNEQHPLFGKLHDKQGIGKIALAARMFESHTVHGFRLLEDTVIGHKKENVKLVDGVVTFSGLTEEFTEVASANNDAQGTNVAGVAPSNPVASSEATAGTQPKKGGLFSWFGDKVAPKGASATSTATVSTSPQSTLTGSNSSK
jgi:hypothetical protein